MASPARAHDMSQAAIAISARLQLAALLLQQEVCYLYACVTAVMMQYQHQAHSLCPHLLQGAVEFLLLARQMEQAFDVAQAHQEMDTFAALVAANAAPAELQRIAAYYESRGELAKAGDVWLRCGQQARAVQLYLQVSRRQAPELLCQNCVHCLL